MEHTISKLIGKALAGKLEGPDKKKFDEWLAESEENRKLYEIYKDDDKLLEELRFYQWILTQ